MVLRRGLGLRGWGSGARGVLYCGACNLPAVRAPVSRKGWGPREEVSPWTPGSLRENGAGDLPIRTSVSSGRGREFCWGPL